MVFGADGNFEGRNYIHAGELIDQELDEPTARLVQEEAHLHDIDVTKRAIISDAQTLRDGIISVQEKQLRIMQASRLSRWLLTRRMVPKIDFGFSEDNPTAMDNGKMTVSTMPLMMEEQITAAGVIRKGWVFQLQCRVPDSVAWYGPEDPAEEDEPPVHLWGNYSASPISIYKEETNELTGSRIFEQWFKVEPNARIISCIQLARKRQELYGDVEQEQTPEEDQIATVRFDPTTDNLFVEFRTLTNEAARRNEARDHRNSLRRKERYEPDQPTGLHLLGLLRGAIRELS
jgi:hypothetical protein